MAFQNVVSAAQKYYPDLKIAYKDQSILMKILGKIMFFNPGFMTDYITTIGDTVYFPTESYTKLHPATCCILLLHEITHIYDEKRLSKPLFMLSYLFPQILFPLAAFFFLLTWKIALPVMLLLTLPFPAFWRMQYEKRAYLVSLYSIYKLSQSLRFDPQLASRAADFVSNFKSSSYYFMWPFDSVDNDFNQAATKIQNNQSPYQDEVLFKMIDNLLANC